MPRYESRLFQPPAPVVEGIVRGPTGQQAEVLLLLDSGADVTVLPRICAHAAGARIRQSGVPLRFYDGSVATFDVAALNLDLLRYRFPGTYVIADAEYGLLGRDILNLLVVTLDGPNQRWSA